MDVETGTEIFRESVFFPFKSKDKKLGLIFRSDKDRFVSSQYFIVR